MIRKLSALILALLLVMSIPMNATAADMTVTQPGEAEKGEEIFFEVRLSEGITVKSGSVELVYDPNFLTLVSAQWHLTGTLMNFVDPVSGMGVFAYIAPTEIIGLVFTARFKVKDDAAYGDASVNINSVFSASGNPAQDGQNFPTEGDVYVSCMNHTPDGPVTCIRNQHCTVCQMVIPAAAHTFDTLYDGDGSQHWQVCMTDGCNAINEYSKAAHTSTGANVATCKTRAICDVCGIAHGGLNAGNHAGGTTIVNASEPDHKTQTAGYTGDTKCLGCGEIIAYGQSIEPDAHTPANVWSNDEIHHWKECNVVGCGVVIDGSKVPHISDKPENKATCQKKAVCDVCGVSYGAVAEHDYSVADKTQDALKTAGNCSDNAVYYYSCSVCGLVENNDNHTFFGDKVAAAHVGGTTIVNASQADHKTQVDGYTGDTKCLGCGEITAYGQTIPAGAHIPASNWTTNGTHHWKVCTVENCGVIIDSSKAAHTATGTNVATCKTQAICDVCDAAHGSLNTGNHAGGTTIVNASEPDHKTQTAGYTGDTKCLGCGEIIAYGQSIEPDAHTPANVWSNDETHHWKECTVVGCGIVIDGSKAQHASTGANVATCQKKAVCDVCGVSYGTVADHDWNTTSWEKDASGHWHKCNTVGCTEKNAFNGHAPDHQGGATEEYAIKCSICQFEIEAQLGHTHVFDKEIAEEQYLASKANCTDPAKYFKSCKCGEKGTETFTSGEALGHTEGTEWKSDADNHWHECSVAGCGVIIDNSKAAHTPDRDAATETDPIKCSVCGYVITPALGHTHAHGTDWKSDKDNHWNECVCGDKANTAVHTDTDKDGKCDTCRYNVGQPADSSSPQTGDNSMISLWIILLCVSALGIVATTVLSKKKSFR